MHIMASTDSFDAVGLKGGNLIFVLMYLKILYNLFLLVLYLWKLLHKGMLVAELYFLICKFLENSPCQNTLQVI